LWPLLFFRVYLFPAILSTRPKAYQVTMTISHTQIQVILPLVVVAAGRP